MYKVFFLSIFVVLIAGAQAPLQSITLIPRPPVNAELDPKALQLLEQAAGELRRANSLEAVVKVAFIDVGDTSSGWMDTVRYLRSGYQYQARHRWTRYDQERESYISVITPKSCLEYAKSRNTIYRCNGSYEPDVALHAFFDQPEGRHLSLAEWDLGRLTDPLVRSLVYKGREQWKGKTYNVVEWVYEQAYTMPEDTVVYSTRVFISLDGLVRKVLTTSTKGYTIDREVLDLKLDTRNSIKLSEQDFNWTPPAGVSEEKRHLNISHTTLVGQRFPEFSEPKQLLDDLKLKSVTSKELLQDKKGLLVWFWNTGCSSCIAEMPHFEQIYREMKDRKTGVVAVDVIKDTSEIAKAKRNLEYNRITMPVLFDADVWGMKLQRVEGPLAVLDANGTVLYDGRYDLIKIRRILEQLAGSY